MAGVGGRREGAGRKKGSPNKINAELKDMILGALDDAGGQKYLVKQAKENPKAFLTLVGRVLPKEITGEGGKSLFPKQFSINFVDSKPGDDDRQ